MEQVPVYAMVLNGGNMTKYKGLRRTFAAFATIHGLKRNDPVRVVPVWAPSLACAFGDLEAKLRPEAFRFDTAKLTEALDRLVAGSFDLGEKQNPDWARKVWSDVVVGEEGNQRDRSEVRGSPRSRESETRSGGAPMEAIRRTWPPPLATAAHGVGQESRWGASSGRPPATDSSGHRCRGSSIVAAMQGKSRDVGQREFTIPRQREQGFWEWEVGILPDGAANLRFVSRGCQTYEHDRGNAPQFR